MILRLSDFRHTAEYRRFMAGTGWRLVDMSSLCKGGVRQYGFLWNIPLSPYSYLSLHKADPSLDAGALDAFCEAHNIYVVRIDFDITRTTPPHLSMVWMRHGYAPVDWCSTPTKSTVINLSATQTELLGNMKPRTRYNIRLAERRGIRLYTYTHRSTNYGYFASYQKLLSETHEKKGLADVSKEQFARLIDSFGDRVFVGIGVLEGAVVAGATFLLGENTASYVQSCSNETGNHHRAPTYILWEAMKEAKRRGARYFDLEGITDSRNPRLTGQWEGITAFKEGFGGRTIYFPLPLQKIYLRENSAVSRLSAWYIRMYLSHRQLPAVYPSELYF